MANPRPFLSLSVVALVILACSAANVNRSGNEPYSQETSKDHVTEKTSGKEDAGEATVEDAETLDVNSKPTFFYAAQASAGANAEDVPKPEVEDVKEPSEDELHKMLEDTVGEIMMADELEGRSLIVPEYMQGMVNQLGGYSMSLQSPYPDFSLPLPGMHGGHHAGHHPSLGHPSAPLYRDPHSFYPPPPPSYGAVPFTSGLAGDCPPCQCSYEDDDHYYDEEEEHYGDEEEYYQEDDDDDVTVPYGFVYDPTIRYEKRSRKRRSLDDYWYDVGEPSKHLAKYNVGYRIKNDLRQRLEDESVYPLHYGHIYTGSLKAKGVHDRPFGYDADFDLYKDSHAFKLKPHGPRLGKKWIWQGYPIYAYNLYKLRDPLKAQELTLKGLKKDVWLEPGIYRFMAILDDLAGLMLEEVKSRDRFIVKDIMTDKRKLSKFQALLPFKDPNAKYVSVKNKILGLVYLIKATPLTGQSPKVKSDLFAHGYSDFSKHVKAPGGKHGTLINSHNVILGKPHFSFH